MDKYVFISFASKDRQIAMTICDALEHRGIGCWISSRDIQPGGNFQIEIVHAIRAAKVVILVFSGNANNSDEIKKEIVLAGQNHLVVIPVRVEDVTPDDAFAYEFATRQWVDLFDDWEHSMQRLVDQLVAVAGVQPLQVGTAEASPDAAEVARATTEAVSVTPAETAPPPEPASPAATPDVAAVLPAMQASRRRRLFYALFGGAVVALGLVGAIVYGLSHSTQSVTPQSSAIDLYNKAKDAEARNDLNGGVRLLRQSADLGYADAQSALGWTIFLDAASRTISARQ